jgi:RNA polymerase sigma-70 factor, ECF subfamily
MSLPSGHAARTIVPTPMATPSPRRPPVPLAIRGPEDDAPSGGRAERRLVRAAQRGSREDFEALFAAHWRRAHRTAWLVVHDAEAAEDIAQEAFIAALKAFDSFDRRRPFGPWLTRIVINRAIDWARARRLRAVGPPVRAAAFGALEDPLYSHEIVAALAALPAEQRAVVVLRHLLEYSPGEIAEMLALPRGTVNSRLRRALDRLGGLLSEESGDGA